MEIAVRSMWLSRVIAFAGITYAASAVCADVVVRSHDAQVTEAKSAVFEFTLSEPAEEVVEFDYTTESETAKADEDFTVVNGTVRFEPGEVQNTITVQTLGDGIEESEESFLLRVSNVRGARFEGTWLPVDTITREAQRTQGAFFQLRYDSASGLLFGSLPDGSLTGGFPKPGIVDAFQQDLQGKWIAAGSAWLGDVLEDSDAFGIDLKVDGNVLAVGAPNAQQMIAPNEFARSGAVFLFNTDSGITFQSRIDPPVTESSNRNASYGSSLVLEGDFLAVGAPGFDNGQERQSGRVFVYSRQDRSFVLQQEIDPPLDDERTFTQFGARVLLLDDTLVATTGTRDRTLLFYQRAAGGGDWTEIQRIVDPTLIGDGGQFGAFLAHDDGRLFVGVPTDQFDGVESIFVYSKGADGKWAESAQIQAPPLEIGASRAGFGYNFDVEDDLLLVGGGGDSTREHRAGTAFLYREAADGIWNLERQLFSPEIRNSGNFGRAVALDKGLLFVSEEANPGIPPPAKTFVYQNDAVRGIIVDNELPEITVEGPLVYEPRQSGVAVFPVTLSEPRDSPLTVTYRVTSGTALKGEDFSIDPNEGTVVFAPGEASQAITVPLLPDQQFEGEETFHVDLLSSSSGTISVSRGTARVVEFADGPTVRAAGVTVEEGDAGTHDATVPLSISPPPAEAVTINYATRDQSATAGEDFEAIQGQLTFNPGETSKNIPVRILGDVLAEPDERLSVSLTGATNAEIRTGWDTTHSFEPTETRNERKFGVKVAASRDIVVIAALETRGREPLPAEITIYGKLDEEWQVLDVLSSETRLFGTAVAVSEDGATVAVGAEDLVILYERDGNSWTQSRMLEPSPEAARSGSRFGEVLGFRGGLLAVGAPGDDVADFEAGAVYLFRHSPGMGWTEVGILHEPNPSGERLASNEFGLFVATDGQLVAVSAERGYTDVFSQHAGGENSWGHHRRINTSGSLAMDAELLAISGHRAVELFERNKGGGNQWGKVKTLRPVAFPAHAPAGDRLAEVVLLQDTLAIGEIREHPTSSEGFIHVYQRPHANADFAIANRIGFSEGDSAVATFSNTSWPLAIADGVIVAGFPDVRSGESFFVGAAHIIESNQAVINITNDEAVPHVGFADKELSREEGEGMVYADLIVRDATRPATLSYETEIGTAGEADFHQVFGQLEIPVGLERTAVRVDFIDDDIPEQELEQFTIRLTSISQGSIIGAQSVVTVTIRDEDGYVVTAPNADVSETAGEATVTLNRTGPRAAEGAFTYSTINGEAIAGEDFTAITGTIALTADEPVAVIKIPITMDNLIEPTEIFYLELSDPDNAGVRLPRTRIPIRISGSDAFLPVNANSIARALVPVGPLQDDWTALDYDHSSWAIGRNGVGYDTDPGGDYVSLIALSLADEMAGKQPGAFVRIPFEVSDPGALSTFTLGMKYDDGFVAWINGHRVADRNAPPTLRWNSQSAGVHDDADAVNFEMFDLSAAIQFLQPGRNVLAIQGLNASPNSSDFLVLPELSFAYPTEYQAWLQQQAGLASTLIGPGQDPDNDGLTNLLEFALGLVPTTGDGDVLRIENNAIRFQLPDPLQPGIDYELQGSGDMRTENWTTLATPSDPAWKTSPVGANRTQVTLDFTQVTTSTERYFRLLVRLNP